MDKITIEDIKEVYAELYKQFDSLLQFRNGRLKYNDGVQKIIGYTGMSILTIKEVADYFKTEVVPNTENKIIKEKADAFLEDLEKNGCIKLFVDEEENGIIKRKGFILSQTYPNLPNKLLNKGVDMPLHWVLDFYDKYPYETKKDDIISERKVL
jgi:hypothetical protein